MGKYEVLRSPNQVLLFMQIFKKSNTLFISIGLIKTAKDGLQYHKLSFGGAQSLIQGLRNFS
jgi:hypothetical protein